MSKVITVSQMKTVTKLMVLMLFLLSITDTLVFGANANTESIPKQNAENSVSDQNKDDIEYLDLEKYELVLYYPDDMVLNDDQLKIKPEWIGLDDDGTMPSQVVVPSYVRIPRFISLPEREVLIPNENGEMEKHTLPALEIDLQEALESNNQIQGSSTAYFVAIYPALTGHCDNQARAIVPSYVPTDSFQGYTWLNTWVPTHGSVTEWGFWRPEPTVAQLCIPKSVYWIYIHPFIGNPPIYFTQLGLYNYPGNWSVNW